MSYISAKTEKIIRRKKVGKYFIVSIEKIRDRSFDITYYSIVVRNHSGHTYSVEQQLTRDIDPYRLIEIYDNRLRSTRDVLNILSDIDKEFF